MRVLLRCCRCGRPVVVNEGRCIRYAGPDTRVDLETGAVSGRCPSRRCNAVWVIEARHVRPREAVGVAGGG